MAKVKFGFNSLAWVPVKKVSLKKKYGYESKSVLKHIYSSKPWVYSLIIMIINKGTCLIILFALGKFNNSLFGW